jgi:excisionase family DNA binding protein
MKKPRAKSSRQSPVDSRQSAAQVSEDQHEVEMMMMEKMLENLLTAQEAAELLGTNDSRIRQLIRDKRISAVKKGKEWIVYKPSLAKYVKTKSRKGRPSSNKPSL